MTVLINKDEVREPLFVIVPVQNPWRWRSRWKHTTRAIKHFMDAGAIVILVEVAFNRREFVFADSGLDGTPANCRTLSNDPRFQHKYIGLRSQSELWLKECQVAIGVQNIPYPSWENVGWFDSDVLFARPNFVGQAIQLLQHYSFLQMFSQARDLTPDYTMMPEDYPHASGHGFVHYHTKEIFKAPVTGTLSQVTQGNSTALTINLATDPPPDYPPPRVFPGLAWSCTRDAWNAMGGLIDFAVWGGSDYHIAKSLLGQKDQLMREDLHPNYMKMIMEWYDRSERNIRKNVGVMDGAIFHMYHGPKVARGYTSKHRLMATTQFDPLRHLKRDHQGLWQLHDDGSDAYIQLRDTMRQIARDRNEDSQDIRMDFRSQGH